MKYLVSGIIGGVGPASTLDYYNDIVTGYRKITNDNSYPNLIIKSIDMTKMLSFVDKKDTKGLVEFAAIASNTPHIVFDELKKVSPLPLVSIVESTCEYAVQFIHRSI